MPLYRTLIDLVYSGRHACLLNPLKYLQACTGERTVGSECYLQANTLSIQYAARSLCYLLKHDAQHILHWNEGELHLEILR